MFAQIYAFQFDPSQAESHVKFVEQVVAPDLRRQPGFKGMQLLIDRERGRALGVSYWASEATARAAADRSANPPAPPEGVQVPETHDLEIATYDVLINEAALSD